MSIPMSMRRFSIGSVARFGILAFALGLTTACAGNPAPGEPADSEAALEAARKRIAAERNGEGALGDGNTLSSVPPVRFAFDSYAVSPEEREKIRKAASFLKDNPGAALRLEGHADERGSADYNFVLGQRRADSVRDVLAGYGVKDARVETRSLGEEFPAAEGSGEGTWSQNRRVEFVVAVP